MSTKSRKQQIQEMLALEPSDAFLRYGLAMEHVGEGDDAEAVRCLQELLTVTADYVPAYQQAGQALIRLGRADEARELLTRGIGVAQRLGNTHAAEEMQGLLGSFGE